MAPPRLRAAVVGCGKLGALHVRAVAGSPHAELVAVCDVQADRAAALAGRWEVGSYADVGPMLHQARPDVVTVATPDGRHAEVTLAALTAGCHVFCEKPLAADEREAAAMVEAAERGGRFLAVNYNRRYGFGYVKARELVAAGAIGTVGHALLTVTDGLPRPELRDNPTVILTTLLTHHIDLLRLFAGEIRSVYARFGAALAGGGPRANVVLSFDFASGAVGAIVAGYREGQTRTAERLELGGSRGTIAVEEVTRRVTLHGADPDRVEVFRPNHFTGGDAFYDTVTAHLDDFLGRVVAGRPPAAGGRDGLRGLQVAAAAERSAALGRPVDVPEPAGAP